MFTGLIEAEGKVTRLRKTGGGGRLRVATPFAAELTKGESVCVNGVCLTVTSVFSNGFAADAVERTLSLTTLGSLVPGDRVNLERALRLGDRVGGHMVTGHVDGVAVVERVTPTSNGRDVTIRMPRQLMRHVAERGSVAVDGVSLTVAALDGTHLTTSLIPETLASTTARRYRAGTKVNVETDLAAKYQESIGRSREDAPRGKGGDASQEGSITLEKLKDLGFAG